MISFISSYPIAAPSVVRGNLVELMVVHSKAVPLKNNDAVGAGVGDGVGDGVGAGVGEGVGDGVGKRVGMEVVLCSKFRLRDMFGIESA